MQFKSELLLFVVVVLGRSAFAGHCPPNEDIVPCTCSVSSNFVRATCSGLRSALELNAVLAGFMGKNVDSFKIENSDLGHVPGNMFKGNHIWSLEFWYSNITDIGDYKDPAFAGLENSLDSLTIVRAFWDEEKPLTKPIKLGHLKKLTYIHSIDNIIPELGDEWYENGPFTLTHLGIRNARVRKLGPNVFSRLDDLRSFWLTGNTVTPRRSMLPDNPQHLRLLDFSRNEIVELPSNMFTNLPSLDELSLSDNNMEHILESAFKTILRQLHEFKIENNPLNCGPKMKWIFENNLQGKVNGECASPDNLKGKSIKGLTSADISD